MAKHWTQTPEGKAKMAAAQKRAWRTRKAKAATRPANATIRTAKPREVRSLMTASKAVVLQIRGLARIGALVKLEQNRREDEAIMALFPELRPKSRAK